MGISFGSTGIKPYVGSKEVKEAYVGSQLVYKAVPPYVYAFLGGETDYYLAPWAKNAGGASIKLESGIYRISTGTSKGATVTMSQIPSKNFKFIAKSPAQTNALKLQYTTGGQWIDIKQFVIGTDYGLQEATIPDNAAQIRLNLTLTTFQPVYLDNIRFE